MEQNILKNNKDKERLLFLDSGGWICHLWNSISSTVCMVGPGLLIDWALIFTKELADWINYLAQSYWTLS